jgi:DNA-binding NarL/FixJ family response regulator
MQYTDSHRILIIDSSPVYRFGLSTILNNLSCVEYVHDSSDIDLNLIHEFPSKYNLLLIGSSKDLYSVIEKITMLSINSFGLKYIILLDSENELLNEMIIPSQIHSIIFKNSDLNEITNAISCIMEGKHYYAEKISFLLEKNKNVKSLIKTQSSKLIMESIMYLMYHEKTSKEISSILNLSPRTVEDYRAKILRATNSENMVGIIKFVLHNNIHNNKLLINKYEPFCIKKNHSEIDYLR